VKTAKSLLSTRALQSRARRLRANPSQARAVYERGCNYEINQIDPPGDKHHRARHASLTLERLLHARLSRFEPNPPAALARVERAA
jgi:hypothetical protein